MTKHSYDKEFKEQAVQYYLDNKDHMTMNEISKNLGVLYAAYLFHIMYILDLNS
ncbi:transposase [Limosilactobacillus fermentum]|jgi:transposase-like protein|uniref:transposase n=1 Tax=Limosilactobacillus fermentum TaxID=1613 RepID=UPI0032673D34